MKLSDYSIKQRKIDAKKRQVLICAGNQYKACGVDRNGKRFTIHSDNVHHIMCYNLWRGNRYVKYADSDKWIKFSTVYN